MRYILLCLILMATLKAAAQSPDPISEGFYSWAALTSPQLILTGDWAISHDGHLTTSEVGASATISIDGAWAVITGELDATICAAVCAAYAGQQVAYTHTGALTISNLSITTLNTLMILQGAVNVTPQPVALIVPPSPSVTYSVHDGLAYAHDRTISTGETLIVVILGASLALSMLRVALEVLWTRR